MTAGAPAPIIVGGQTFVAGSRGRAEMPIARLMSGAPMSLPVLVLHGAAEGPAVWLSGAIHGDELCGVEIIRRVLDVLDPATMAGTVIAVPVVNVFGFNTGERYLPDRRDLNRSFPGSSRGSLASRIANLFMSEVVAHCSVGIDLHTGSDDRINLPQIRADLDDPETRRLAAAFAPPIAIHSRIRDGSLRQAATEAGATVLLYEGGEATRFDEASILAGRDGVQRVLQSLGVITGSAPAPADPLISYRSRWIRAPRSGILHLQADLGAHVARGATIAVIRDPFGIVRARVTTRIAGIVVGHRQHPLVNQGDAVAHIAEIRRDATLVD